MTSAIVAAILSLFIPGLGQLYEGQKVKKGILLLIIAVFLYICIYTINTNIGVIMFIYSIYAAYDAYKFLKQ